jgi:metallo-beta-lactamase family protein
MITVTAHGAAQEVTGSKHLLDIGSHRILVDCGVFQGHREECRQKNATFPFDPESVDVCVNTHGHLDHCGNYPLLVKNGFGGEILSTPATRDVAKVVMFDSAHIQQADARYLEKLQKKYPKPNRKIIPPLYDEADVTTAAARYRPVDYDQPREIGPGVKLTLRDAGHILGSAIAVFEIATKSGPLTVAFTGDLGRRGMPILRDPAEIGAVDYLVCESTYGNRQHDELAFAEEELSQVVTDTANKGGMVIVPAFAIGRTQELIYNLHHLYLAGRIPDIPIFVDSPMAISVTDIFRAHPECYDEETLTEFSNNGKSPFAFSSLKFTRSVEESKAIAERTPCVVISASGMCESGRILHHLAHGVGDPRNTILVVGFMAQNTLGRALADKRKEVRIFGETYPVNARVKILNAFSAHADYRELGGWVTRLDRNRLKAVFLVHGEQTAEEAFRAHLLSLGVPRVDILEADRPVALD